MRGRVRRTRPESNAAPVADELLLERSLQGDARAFERLYERYFPPVYRFVASRLNNRADTEDTVQQVFLSAFSSLASFRGEGAFGAWVFGIARRTVANRFKKKRIPTVALEPEFLEQSLLHRMGNREPDPLEICEYRERVSRLQDTLASDLSDLQRRLFQLHHLEHRSIREIAGLLRKSEDAVKSHLYRARRLLLAG